MANKIDLSGGKNLLQPNGVVQTKNSLRSYSMSFVDEAARVAGVGITPADITSLALQEDTNTLWMLTNAAPVTWLAVGVDASPWFKRYNDAAARTGDATLTANDVGKCALQLDLMTLWQLTAAGPPPVWARVAGDHGTQDGLGDDDHTQYRLKAEQLVPVVATPRVASVADAGTYLMWGGLGTLNITLPAANTLPSGGWIGAWNFGSASPRVNLNRAGADTLTIGTSTGAASLYTTVRGSMARLVSNGVNGWLLIDASGTWTDGSVIRHFDGTIALGANGNIVTIGNSGDIRDGGVALADLATTAYVSAMADGGGSDMTIYSNVAGDFSAIQTGADTIGVFGLPFAITAVQIKRIINKPTGNAVAVIAARGATLECTWQPSGSIPLAGTLMTASLGTLASTDEYIIEIDGPPKAYNAATDSAKSMVTNALHYCNDGVIADLTADTVEIVKPLLADGYNAFSLTAMLGGVADDVTVLGSNDPTGSADYYDVTVLALGVNKVTVSGAYQSSEPLMFQFIKIVIDGTTSAKVALTRFRK